MDDEAANLALGFLADISVNTTRIVELLEEDGGEETEEDSARASTSRAGRRRSGSAASAKPMRSG